MWSRTWLTRLAPGLGLLLGYQRQWWLSVLRAGLSVATVAMPVGIAYAALAGVPAGHALKRAAQEYLLRRTTSGTS